ncbi:hypothetical protein ACNKHS_05430 [Shigella flexneri]
MSWSVRLPAMKMTTSKAACSRAGEEGVAALNRILPRLDLLADDTLADRVDEIGNVGTRHRKRRALCSSRAINWQNWSRWFPR